jgi:cytochrome c-type biogenesis protein
MINDLFTWLNSLLTGNILLILTGSFIWGVMSILLSPCHLSSIPLVVGFIIGSKGAGVKSAFSISLVFAGGILIIIALIGIVTASMGRILGDIGTGADFIIPVVLLVSGLYLLDVFRIGSFGLNTGNYNFKSYWKIFVLGVVIGIGLGPCTFAFMAPVLGIVFQFASENMFMAILILTLFAIGHCAIIIAAGTLSKRVQIYLNWNENSNVISRIKKVLGAVIVLSSVYLFGISFY